MSPILSCYRVWESLNHKVYFDQNTSTSYKLRQHTSLLLEIQKERTGRGRVKERDRERVRERWTENREIRIEKEKKQSEKIRKKLQGLCHKPSRLQYVCYVMKINKIMNLKFSNQVGQLSSSFLFTVKLDGERTQKRKKMKKSFNFSIFLNQLKSCQDVIPSASLSA